MRMASSCSCALSPSSLASLPPTCSACLRAPTWTMKNSSRLVRKIERNRTRASRGTVASSASASTRPLNSSQLSWLLRKWSLAIDCSATERGGSRRPAMVHSRAITPGESTAIDSRGSPPHPPAPDGPHRPPPPGPRGVFPLLHPTPRPFAILLPGARAPFALQRAAQLLRPLELADQQRPPGVAVAERGHQPLEPGPPPAPRADLELLERAG